MLETATLLYTVGSFVGNSVASGILGGHADRYAIKNFNPIFKRFQKSHTELPQNEHLERAVRKAILFACSVCFHAFLEAVEVEELNGRPWDYHVDKSALVAAYKTFIKREEERLEAPFPNFTPDPVYGKMELLLSASETNQQHLLFLRENLKVNLTDYLLLELNSELSLSDLPPLFKQMLQHGWVSEGIQFDWFDIMVLKFADILKDPEDGKAMAAYQARLLADIKVDTALAHEMLMNLMERYQESSSVYPSLERFGDEVSRWLSSIQDKLDDISNVGLDSNLAIKQTSHQVAGISDKIDIVRGQLEGIGAAKLDLHHFLNEIPAHLDQFVGRDYDLEQLIHVIGMAEKIVLVNGLGGIGKTTLAKKFVQKYHARYRHVAWVTVTGKEDLNREGDIESFIAAFVYDRLLIEQGLRLQLHESLSDKEKFQEIIYRLQNVPGENLLVIDNAGLEIKHFISRLPSPPGWHIMVTSRVNVNGFQPYMVGALSFEHAMALFLQWYEQGSADLHPITLLITEVDRHTLMIELLAKTLQESMGEVTPAHLLSTIREKKLDDPALKEIIQISRSHEETDLFNHILQTFRISSLQADEKSILELFYFIPSEPFAAEKLTDWFGLPENERAAFKSKLKDLYRKGWLQFQPAQGFQMHRLIQTVVFYELKPRLESANGLLSYLSNETWFFNKATLAQKIHNVPYISYVLNQINGIGYHNLLSIKLLMTMGLVYSQILDYESEMMTFQFAKDLLEKLEDQNEPSVRHGLALCYSHLGDPQDNQYTITEKEGFLRKALAIWQGPELHLESQKINLRVVMIKLADLYMQINDVDQAGYFYLSALEVARELYEIEPGTFGSTYISSLISLSQFYKTTQLEKAKEFADLALLTAREGESYLGAVDLSEAITVSADIEYLMGGAFSALEESMFEAIRLTEIAVDESPELYVHNLSHKHTVLADMYQEEGLYKKAFERYLLANEIAGNVFSDDAKQYVILKAGNLSRAARALTLLNDAECMYYFGQAQQLYTALAESDSFYQRSYMENQDLMGFYHFQNNRFETALEIFQQSKAYYSEKVKDGDKGCLEPLLQRLNNMFAIHSRMDNYSLAIDNLSDYYNLALDITEEKLISNERIAEAAFNLCKLYYLVNDYARAWEAAKNCFLIMHLYTTLLPSSPVYRERVEVLVEDMGMNFELFYANEIYPNLSS